MNNLKHKDNPSLPPRIALKLEEKLTAQVLEAEVAVMSARLFAFLTQRFDEKDPVMGAALQFLAKQSEGASVQQPSIEGIVQRVSSKGTSSLSRLVGSLSLNNAELALLVLVGLAQHREGFGDVFASLHPRQQPYPTVTLAAQLLAKDLAPEEDFVALLKASSLFKKGLLKTQGAGPVFSLSITVDHAVWLVISKGQAGATFSCPDKDLTEFYQSWLNNPDVEHVIACVQHQLPCSIFIYGHDLKGALFRASSLAKYAGAKLLRFNCQENLGDEEAEGYIHFYWHCLLSGAIPLFNLGDKTLSPEFPAGLLDDYPLPVIFVGRAGNFPTIDQRITLSLVIDKLGVQSAKRVWSSVLPELAAASMQLAARYPSEPYEAQLVASSVREISRRQGTPISIDAVDAFFKHSRGANLPECVQLIRPTLSWTELVLPDVQHQQLTDAIDRLNVQHKVLDDWQFLARRRGARGVRMLFSGPPGTGKTLSAEVMAHTLNMDLLVVDISRVVSKWVGETEKNLASVFNQAEKMRAVLFFDEADAIFGKRTEVSDAHDKYANLETAYLLSRLESYDGLAILATNYRNNIDAAFIRRLDFVVEFREPSVAQRKRLWQCHVPKQAPLASDVNFAELANLYPMVGGEIRNAAAGAAYLAAAQQSSEEGKNTAVPSLIQIHQDHFIQAIRREYEKTGKAFREVKSP